MLDTLVGYVEGSVSSSSTMSSMGWAVGSADLFRALPSGCGVRSSRGQYAAKQLVRAYLDRSLSAGLLSVQCDGFPSSVSAAALALCESLQC